MAASVTLYNQFKENQVIGNAVNFKDTDTLKVALLTSAYTPDYDTHEFFDDLTNEVSGTGYTAGGVALTNKAVSIDTVNDEVDVDADDPTWTGLDVTAHYAVLYKDTGTPSTSPLILCMNLDADVAPGGSDLVLRLATDGYLVIS